MTNCLDCKHCNECRLCDDVVVCNYVGCNVKYATRYGDCVAYKPKDEEADK